LVLQAIFDEGPVSRADLARATGLGKATVSEISGTLLAEGLVAEVGQGSSTGGKPPTLLELDPGGRFAVAVDLSVRPIEAALLDLRGRIVADVNGKTTVPSGQDAVEEIHRTVAELVGNASAPALGIGFGVPGVVDDDGRVVTSDYLEWSDLPLRDEIEEIYGLPTYVAGAAEAAAIAEFGRGGSTPDSDLLYVKLDDGISVGIVTAGRIHHTMQRGGDLTHVAVPGAEHECTCGRRGCLGAVTSVVEVLGPDFTNLGSEARRRLSAEAIPRLDEAAAALGIILAPIIAALDTDRVVVGGLYADWATFPRLVSDAVEEALGWAPAIEATRLGASSVLLGAGGMVLSGELGVVWS
jgi:predicted NBD/HSP70 family sugar kinase